MKLHQNLYFDRFLLMNVYNISAIKITKELSFMILTCYAKFEEKLIFGVENDMSNMENVYQKT